MGLFSWLSGMNASDSDVRSEIWRLGTRHGGWPLEGALEELKTPNLEAGKARLLRACIRKLRSQRTTAPTEVS